MRTALVCGAGGFIGSHLVKRLKAGGYWVRGVDLKRPDFSDTYADEFLIFDLRNPRDTEAVMRLDQTKEFNYLKKPFLDNVPFDEVYQLAANMGGAGWVFSGDHDAEIISDSALININVAAWAKIYGVGKVFYSSSACMYPQEIQQDYHNKGLKESDAYPLNPDSDYGLEKAFSERLYLAYQRNYGLDVRIARFHNIYGPEGTYKGGKEKAPAAMCRKVIECLPVNSFIEPTALDKEVGIRGRDVIKWKEEIEIWGTGHQTRSFLYIDDCLDAVRLQMDSDFKEPINIGSEEMVTINQLAEMAIGFSGKAISIKHISGPTGVMGRNSDNTLIREKLGWEPKYSLKEGLKLTFDWISKEMSK